MKRLPNAVFWTTAAGMELSWVYAWAAFIMDAVGKRPYPLPEAVAMFGLAALVTAFIRGRGWLNIQILLIHGAGLTAFALRGVHLLWYRTEVFWSLTWLEDFFSRAREPVAWFPLAVFWTGMIVFWVSGIRYARCSTAYPAISIRFDKGLTWLFVLLLVKLFMRTQLGLPSAESVSEAMIFPFFVFGLPAVALARNRSGSQKGFMSGYRGVGLIISFSAAIFLCGTGLVLLFMPYLQAASEAGYEALKTTGNFFAPILVKILMFLFGYKPAHNAVPEIIPRKGPPENLPEMEPVWWAELFIKIYAWFLWMLLGLLFVFILGVGAWFLWRWLFARTRKTARDGGAFGFFLQWLERRIAYLQLVCDKFFGRKKGNEAIRLYGKLLSWGRRSGLPNRRSETPLEYGRRLKQPFKALSAEIDLIISGFNRYVYGAAVWDERESALARQALQRLRRPMLWPKRFKLWFLSSG